MNAVWPHHGIWEALKILFRKAAHWLSVKFGNLVNTGNQGFFFFCIRALPKQQQLHGLHLVGDGN